MRSAARLAKATERSPTCLALSEAAVPARARAAMPSRPRSPIPRAAPPTASATTACVPTGPVETVCNNGPDDDCDGRPDEALGEITCGEGVCARDLPACTGGLPPELDDERRITLFNATDRRQYERELLIARRKAEDGQLAADRDPQIATGV